MESNWASERDSLRDEAAREATATAAMRLKLESDLATAQHSLYQESQARLEHEEAVDKLKQSKEELANELSGTMEQLRAAVTDRERLENTTARLEEERISLQEENRQVQSELKKALAALEEEARFRSEAKHELDTLRVENQLVREAADAARSDVQRMLSEGSDRSSEWVQRREGYEVQLRQLRWHHNACPKHVRAPARNEEIRTHRPTRLLDRREYAIFSTKRKSFVGSWMTHKGG
eukprot:scaffold5101_cov403-Prasinococcus_capsulatus_cf.AAC.7